MKLRSAPRIEDFTSKSHVHRKKTFQSIEPSAKAATKKLIFPKISWTKVEQISIWILIRYAIIVSIAHFLILMAMGTVIATPFLRLAIYIFITWIFTFLIGIFKLNRKWNYSVTIVMALLFCYDHHLSNNFRLQGYGEKNGDLSYTSMYRFHSLWATKDYPNDKSDDSVETIKKAEFSYTYRLNNLKFRGPDFHGKIKGKKLVMAGGDSYTAGTEDVGQCPFRCRLVAHRTPPIEVF